MRVKLSGRDYDILSCLFNPERLMTMNLRTLQGKDQEAGTALLDANNALEETQKAATERIAEVTAEENSKVEDAQNEQIQASGASVTARKAFAHGILSVGGTVYDPTNNTLYKSANDGTDYTSETVPQVDIDLPE